MPYLGRPVPERDHLVRVHPDRDGVGSGQAKVGQLYAAVDVKQHILRLDVAVWSNVGYLHARFWQT